MVTYTVSQTYTLVKHVCLIAKGGVLAKMLPYHFHSLNL